MRREDRPLPSRLTELPPTGTRARPLAAAEVADRDTIARLLAILQERCAGSAELTRVCASIMEKVREEDGE